MYDASWAGQTPEGIVAAAAVAKRVAADNVGVKEGGPRPAAEREEEGRRLWRQRRRRGRKSLQAAS